MRLPDITELDGASVAVGTGVLVAVGVGVNVGVGLGVKVGVGVGVEVGVGVRGLPRTANLSGGVALGRRCADATMLFREEKLPQITKAKMARILVIVNNAKTGGRLRTVFAGSAAGANLLDNLLAGGKVSFLPRAFSAL